MGLVVIVVLRTALHGADGGAEARRLNKRTRAGAILREGGVDEREGRHRCTGGGVGVVDAAERREGRLAEVGRS